MVFFSGKNKKKTKLVWSHIFISSFFSQNENSFIGTSLVVQWLRLLAPNAQGLGSIPGQGTRSHLLQLRVHLLRLKDPVCCS